MVTVMIDRLLVESTINFFPSLGDCNMHNYTNNIMTLLCTLSITIIKKFSSIDINSNAIIIIYNQFSNINNNKIIIHAIENFNQLDNTIIHINCMVYVYTRV